VRREETFCCARGLTSRSLPAMDVFSEEQQRQIHQALQDNSGLVGDLYVEFAKALLHGYGRHWLTRMAHSGNNIHNARSDPPSNRTLCRLRTHRPALPCVLQRPQGPHKTPILYMLHLGLKAPLLKLKPYHTIKYTLGFTHFGALQLLLPHFVQS